MELDREIEVLDEEAQEKVANLIALAIGVLDRLGLSQDEVSDEEFKALLDLMTYQLRSEG